MLDAASFTEPNDCLARSRSAQQPVVDACTYGYSCAANSHFRTPLLPAEGKTLEEIEQTNICMPIGELVDLEAHGDEQRVITSLSPGEVLSLGSTCLEPIAAVTFDSESSDNGDLAAMPLVSDDVESDTEDGNVVRGRERANAAASAILASAGRDGRISRNQVGKVMSLWRTAKNRTRKKVRPDGAAWVPSDTVGLSWNFFSQKWGITKPATSYPAFVQLLNRYLLQMIPGTNAAERFKFTCATINVDFACKKHRDSGNAGPSAIMTCGNYTGGLLRYWKMM